MSIPKVDVFDGLPESEIREQYQAILAMRNWNDSQTATFQMLRQLPGNGFAFFEGIFGCGKTLIQATITKLLAALGKHVLIVAPTNAALGALSKSLVEVAPELNAVRVVFAGAEEVRKFGRVEQVDQEVENAEFAMVRLLQGNIASRALRYDVLPEHDLKLHVNALADAMHRSSQTLLFTYQPDEAQDAEEHDAVALYLQFRSTDFESLISGRCSKAQRDLHKSDRQLFVKALKTLQEKVIRDSRVVLCTQQLAASALIRKNFATVTNGVTIISDEDGQALEPNAWIPVVLLASAENVQAVLRFGDRLQLPPLALSANSKFSEFGLQINRSLIDRHLRQHPPAATLNVQYRMHPVLASFPNKFTYGNRLRSDPSCRDLQVDEIFSQRLCEWARPFLPSSFQFEGSFSRLLGLNVRDAYVEVDPVTQSRSNRKNVDAVKGMLLAMYNETPYPTSNIVIMTPYNAQRAHYLAVVRDLAVLTGLSFNSLPSVATVDSMQGHEYDVVILDWVNGISDRLGFLTDNRRVNVALTRARRGLIVVFNDTTSQDNKGDAKPFMGKTPEVVAHWNYLRVIDVVIETQVETESETQSEEQLADDNGADAAGSSWALSNTHSADEGNAGNDEGSACVKLDDCAEGILEDDSAKFADHSGESTKGKW